MIAVRPFLPHVAGERVRTDLRQSGGVIARLFGQLAHFASCGIVVKELERRDATMCAIERDPNHGDGGRRTFLFRFEMCSFMAGKYEFILPSGSRIVVR